MTASGISLSSLHVYPVKSCGGIAAERLEIGERGLLHDRGWMVVDESGRFVTQRERPEMAQVDVRVGADALTLRAKGIDEVLTVPFGAAGLERREVVVWRDTCESLDEGDAAARWLERALGARLRLVRMAEDWQRRVNPARSPEPAVTGFADGYPILLISEASLEDLNRRMDRPLPMNRFRPNLVVRGCAPYAEDGWKRIRIGAIEMDVCKPCGRCGITTTDQETLARSPEPLATLASYRRFEGEVVFGQNAVHRGTGLLSAGDAVEILAEGDPPAIG